jgi:hypothetical protein
MCHFSTLHDQLKGHQFQRELHDQNHQLSLFQEEALVEWIISRDEHGAAPRPCQMQDMANLILATPSQLIKKN